MVLVKGTPLNVILEVEVSLLLNLVSILGAVVAVIRVGVVSVEPLLELEAKLVDLGLVPFLGLLGQLHVLGVLLIVVNDKLHEVHVVKAHILEELSVVLVLFENGDSILHLVVGLLVGEPLGHNVEERLPALLLSHLWVTEDGA